PGNPSNPGNPKTPVIKHLGSYGFVHPDTEVFGVFSKDGGDTSVVLMPLGEGKVYLGLFSGGDFILETVQSANGDLERLYILGHLFKFYDYTETQVTVTYSHG